MIKDKIFAAFTFLKNKFPILKNKYVITLILYSIWVGGFDENSIMSDIKYKSEIKQLQTKIEAYKKDIAESIKKSNELRTNNENLEKFAREQYKMKKTQEDIYIVQ